VESGKSKSWLLRLTGGGRSRLVIMHSLGAPCTFEAAGAANTEHICTPSLAVDVVNNLEVAVIVKAVDDYARSRRRIIRKYHADLEHSDQQNVADV